MPNDCHNLLVIYGPEPEIERFMDGLQKKDDEYQIIYSYFPCPQELANVGRSWKLANWGTKWGDYCTKLMYKSAWCIAFEFVTANTPPRYAIDHIATLFPKLEFQLIFGEILLEFKGNYRWKAGELVGLCNERMDEQWLEALYNSIEKESGDQQRRLESDEEEVGDISAASIVADS